MKIINIIHLANAVSIFATKTQNYKVEREREREKRRQVVCINKGSIVKEISRNELNLKKAPIAIKQKERICACIYGTIKEDGECNACRKYVTLSFYTQEHVISP